MQLLWQHKLVQEVPVLFDSLIYKLEPYDPYAFYDKYGDRHLCYTSKELKNLYNRLFMDQFYK